MSLKAIRSAARIRGRPDSHFRPFLAYDSAYGHKAYSNRECRSGSGSQRSSGRTGRSDATQMSSLCAPRVCITTGRAYRNALLFVVAVDVGYSAVLSLSPVFRRRNGGMLRRGSLITAPVWHRSHLRAVGRPHGRASQSLGFSVGTWSVFASHGCMSSWGERSPGPGALYGMGLARWPHPADARSSPCTVPRPLASMSSFSKAAAQCLAPSEIEPVSPVQYLDALQDWCARTVTMRL